MNKTVILILLFGFLATSNVSAEKTDDAVKIPFQLSKGQITYEKYCSSCHGKDLNGTKKGPPFLHGFYKPSHHGDASFYRAALKGVRAHHWNFGNMEPVKGMTERKTKHVIAYIRFYQKQKNLF